MPTPSSPFVRMRSVGRFSFGVTMTPWVPDSLISIKPPGPKQLICRGFDWSHCCQYSIDRTGWDRSWLRRMPLRSGSSAVSSGHAVRMQPGTHRRHARRMANGTFILHTGYQAKPRRCQNGKMIGARKTVMTPVSAVGHNLRFLSSQAVAHACSS